MNRYKWIFTVSLLLTTGVCTSCLAQAANLRENPIWEPCPPLPNLPQSDSVARRATVDSIASLIVGRWELVEISSGWGPDHVPARSVEITINSQQQGLVNENGSEVARFQLTLSRRWIYMQFKIEQQGASIFHFVSSSRGHQGRIYACGQKLIISDGRGDGTAFAFRRIPDHAPGPPVNQHAVTALLNYTRWAGSVQAMRVLITSNQLGVPNRITMQFITGQPYADYPANVKADGTTATNQQPVVQRLCVSNVPLAVGRYEIKMLTDSIIAAIDMRFELVAGNRVLDTWQPPNAGSGWMKITRYDPATKTIEGSFDFYLLNSIGKTAYFQDGAFTAMLTN